MEIIQYEPTLLKKLTEGYNNITRHVPHCYRVDENDFADAVAGITGDGVGHEQLHSEAGFVAKDGDALRGFMHVGIRHESDERAPTGVIYFFWYERGHRVAGQALLEAAEAYFREQNQVRVEAFSQHIRYPFYHFANAFLSDHLDHVQALLAFNGYDRTGGEVFLDWLDYDVVPTPTAVAAEISIEWDQGRGERPGCVVQANRDDKVFGTCVALSGGEYSRVDEAQDWLFIISLGVLEDVRHHGLGRHLLLRSLQEMRGKGYRHASISTSLANHRAFLFYSNCGFHVVDWTYGYSRELTDDDD